MEDFEVNKRAKMVVEEDLDRISQLPETVLLLTLSFLSVEEAARTSVLSTHWRYLWLFAVDEFNFGFIMPQDLELPLDVHALKGRYFDWVNQVLGSHCDHVEEGAVLKKLRFQFPLGLDRWCFEQIDGWISYAFTRRVQSLELDFLMHSDPIKFILNIYCFPGRMVCETDGLSSLRSLSLSGVSVSREDIDSFLLKFSFLERLKVCAAPKLQGIEIGSSSPALKHLEITNCGCLKYAIVRDTSLVSLTFTNVENLFLQNNPKLVSVCISAWYARGRPILQMLSSCLSSLQILTLFINYKSDDEFLDQVPQLSELKKLAIISDPMKQDTLIRIAALLSVSPNLEKLVLDFEEMDRNCATDFRRYRKGTRFHLENLKDVEVRGFYGTVAEAVLLTYIFRLVVAPIERIIFNPHNSMYLYARPLTSRRALKRAELLRGVIPSSPKFIVL